MFGRVQHKVMFFSAVQTQEFLLSGRWGGDGEVRGREGERGMRAERQGAGSGGEGGGNGVVARKVGMRTMFANFAFRKFAKLVSVVSIFV